MVIAASVATVRAEISRLAPGIGVCDAEIVSLGVYGGTHILDQPSARRREGGAEYVESSEARVAVGCEIHHRVGEHIWEHLVAGSVDGLAEVLEAARALAQVDAPDVLAPGARHV